MPESGQEKAAYQRMVKATSVMAGAKFVTIFIAILKNKVVAVILGPAGMGTVSLVLSSVEMTRVLFAFGLDGATVRKVAQASADDDPAVLDQAYRVAARTGIFIGTSAFAALGVSSPFLSARFLGSSENYWWYLIAGCSLIVTPLLGVELAFLQGLKKSRDLATCQIIASFVGSILTVVLVGTMGRIGAIVALLPVAAMSVLIHHHFLKRYRPEIQHPRRFNQLLESKKLLSLGSGFAINGIWLVASGWLNLIFIQSYYGRLEGVLQVGLYGAASTLANFYIGILVSSMGTEFYPTLVNAAHDRPAMSRLLNQQTLLAIATGVPVSLFLLVFSPWALSLLYTREFIAGSELMRWMVVGMAIRFASCPLGFTLLAVGSPRLIALSELVVGIVTISLSYVFLQIFGLSGIGVGIVLANCLYLAGIVMVMSRRGVVWNTVIALFVIETFGILAACLGVTLLLPPIQGTLICLGISICYFIHLVVLIRKESGIRFAQITQKLRDLTRRKHI